jgi:hypothetical protein
MRALAITLEVFGAACLGLHVLLAGNSALNAPWVILAANLSGVIFLVFTAFGAILYLAFVGRSIAVPVYAGIMILVNLVFIIRTTSLYPLSSAIGGVSISETDGKCYVTEQVWSWGHERTEVRSCTSELPGMVSRH